MGYATPPEPPTRGQYTIQAATERPQGAKLREVAGGAGVPWWIRAGEGSGACPGADPAAVNITKDLAYNL
jgi:hypothetical protein